MAIGQDRREKALLAAIQFETDGRAFFLEAATKTSDFFGRIIFTSLADEERDHIERIHAIDRSLRDHGTWPPRQDRAGGKEGNIFEEARHRLDETIRDRTDDLEAVKLAMGLEQNGIEFYSDLAAKAADPREREFYQRLAAEEKRHLEVLENTWSALAACSSSMLE
jgi:rubrerythrin